MDALSRLPAASARCSEMDFSLLVLAGNTPKDFLTVVCLSLLRGDAAHESKSVFFGPVGALSVTTRCLFVCRL